MALKQGVDKSNRFSVNHLGIKTSASKAEVDSLKEELMKKDRELDIAERKLRTIQDAYEDLSEK